MSLRKFRLFSTSTQFTTLAKNSNQALGLGQYAIDFLKNKEGPNADVLKRTEQFHTDSVFCGISALALGTRAPTLLRNEALRYPVPANETGAHVFGSQVSVKPEKAVVANSSAVREWDSNGTVFGYNPKLGHIAGEFGHNDFYPVVVAACQKMKLGGDVALRGMVLTDEIRGRLAEVFSLKTYKIDHVVHGAIASAAAYGALCGATPEQIESAIGMVVAHYIPWRAIRAGKQLSDSKGASAAISAEVAVLAMERSMNGFVGPRDIFRNPEAIFRYFEPTQAQGQDRWTEVAPSPFDLVLAQTGSDFAVMGMHFKLGLYEHQSAGAIQGVLDLLSANPQLAANGGENIKSIKIVAYEPAYGIIGNPAKMNPKTRQSADHSMAYIVATLIRKIVNHIDTKGALPASNVKDSNTAMWKQFMLGAYDYKEDETALHNPLSRKLMTRISFEHGGKSYDEKYPDGIPTSVVIVDKNDKTYKTDLIMYPGGHARNTTADLDGILNHKFNMWAGVSVKDVPKAIAQVSNLAQKPASAINQLYNFDINVIGGFL